MKTKYKVKTRRANPEDRAEVNALTEKLRDLIGDNPKKGAKILTSWIKEPSKRRKSA